MKEHYAIVEIDTMNIKYRGTNLAAAATSFCPGTVHGKGFDDETAIFNAKSVAFKILNSRGFSKKKKNENHYQL